MNFNKRVVKVLAVIVLGTVLVQIVGCGTIFYPERRGQSVHGGIDIVVAIADSVWFLAYIIPGLIAWGVDLYTGAIYLPAGKKRFAGPPDGKDIVVIKVDPEQLDQKMMEEIVSNHVGQKINLDDPNLQILKFNGTDTEELKAFLSRIDENDQSIH